MTDIIFHIDMGDGVVLKIPGTWESKHFDIFDVEFVGQNLAKKLGGSFIRTETEDD